MTSLKKLDPMDEIAEWAEKFAIHCHAVSKRAKADPNLLPHGFNSLVGALLDKGFDRSEIETALNDALRNGYLKASD